MDHVTISGVVNLNQIWRFPMLPLTSNSSNPTSAQDTATTPSASQSAVAVTNDLASTVLSGSHPAQVSLIKDVVVKPIPKETSNADEMEKIFNSLLNAKENDEELAFSEKLENEIKEQQAKINEKQEKLKQTNKKIALMTQTLTTIQSQNAQLLVTEGKMKAVFKKIEDSLRCKGCARVVALHIVFGLCGHTRCTDCVHYLMNKYPKGSIVCSTACTKTKEMTTPIYTQPKFLQILPLPVIPLKNIATLLHQEGIVTIPNQTVTKPLDQKAITYKPISLIENGKAAFTLRDWTDVMRGKIMAEELIKNIVPQHWAQGIYIQFANCFRRENFFYNCFNKLREQITVSHTPPSTVLVCQIIEKEPTINNLKEAKEKVFLIRRMIDEKAVEVNSTLNTKLIEYYQYLCKGLDQHLTAFENLVNNVNSAPKPDEKNEKNGSKKDEVTDPKPEKIDSLMQEIIKASKPIKEILNTYRVIKVHENGELEHTRSKPVAAFFYPNEPKLRELIPPNLMFPNN